MSRVSWSSVVTRMTLHFARMRTNSLAQPILEGVAILHLLTLFKGSFK